MADQTLSALRELTNAVVDEFFGNDTNLSRRLIKATNEAQLLLMVQPPDDDLTNHPAPVEPADDLIDYQDFTELCARHSFFCDDDESAETLHEMIQEAIAADRARRPALVEPVTPIDLDALLSPAGPYETGPDAAMADGAQLVRDRHGNPTWWAPMHGCDSLDDLLDQIRSRILPHLRPPANHFPGATEMVAPPAEGEAWEQVVWLRSLIGESVWFEPGSENASKLAHAAYVLLNQSDQIAELQRQLNRRTRPNG